MENYLKSRGVTVTSMGEKSYQKLFIQARHDLRAKKLDEVGRSWVMVLVGFVLALFLVTFLGLFLASFIGRTLWQTLESTIIRIPIVKQIYPYVKQVTDYVFGQKKLDFSRVVAVQYPRLGVWSLGFVTGPAISSFQEMDSEGREYVTVFIPTSPTPFTGFVITALKQDVLDLPLTIDQVFRFLISGGVVSPEITLLSADNENKEANSGKDGV
ncbi:MAG: DUF502 domain-containing protein [Phycisphaerae bacterium]